MKICIVCTGTVRSDKAYLEQKQMCEVHYEKMITRRIQSTMFMKVNEDEQFYPDPIRLYKGQTAHRLRFG